MPAQNRALILILSAAHALVAVKASVAPINAGRAAKHPHITAKASLGQLACRGCPWPVIGG
jgi:hypothetical protein